MTDIASMTCIPHDFEVIVDDGGRVRTSGNRRDPHCAHCTRAVKWAFYKAEQIYKGDAV